MKRSKEDIIATVEAELIAATERDDLPVWRKPWSGDGIAPANYYSKRPYRGINVFWLDLIGQAKGYESSYWTTAKAAITNHGAYPAKGEKASYAILWKPVRKADRDTGEEITIWLLREYAVFNSDQIPDLPKIEVERAHAPLDIPASLREIRDSYKNPPRLEYRKQDQAYYSPSRDEIVLPEIEQFTSLAGYAETFLHEHAHSTGHPDRENRFDLTAFCSRDYAFEELVAEITACMAMHHVGIEPDHEGMASYVKGWASRLRDEPGTLMKAMGKAQKAFDRMTGWSYKEEEVAA